MQIVCVFIRLYRLTFIRLNRGRFGNINLSGCYSKPYSIFSPMSILWIKKRRLWFTRECGKGSHDFKVCLVNVSSIPLSSSSLPSFSSTSGLSEAVHTRHAFWQLLSIHIRFTWHSPSKAHWSHLAVSAWLFRHLATIMRKETSWTTRTNHMNTCRTTGNVMSKVFCTGIQRIRL